MPALSPAMFNVATIVVVVVLAPLMPRYGLPPIMAVAIAVNVIASLALVRVIGFQGLALGTSIAAIANAALLLGLLRRRLGGLEGGRLMTTLLKVTVAALALMATVLGVEAFGDAVGMAESRVRKWLGK